MREVKCDIIICGGGLAGLSLLYRAMKSGIWNNLSIIVLDKSDKSKNDKTWSFWKKGATEFDELIFKDWHHLIFYTNKVERRPLATHGYTYNSIRSIDFYAHVLEYLKQFATISFEQAIIDEVIADKQECRVITQSTTYTSNYLFNSIYQKPELRRGDHYFLQHFKGLRIKCKYERPAIDEAYLMDFRATQVHGTTFFYTLPISEDELFIEYTLFSKSVLSEKDYDIQLKAYITGVLNIRTYDVLEEEFGVIPMTNYRFKRFNENIINIGTAGGDTRPSTGYTFTNLQKTISKILISWQQTGTPFFREETLGLKHQLYDATLLGVLAARKYPGYKLFGDLFKKTPAPVIFRFLDAETSIWEDLSVMASLRIFPFLKEFMIAIFWRIFSKK